MHENIPQAAGNHVSKTEWVKLGDRGSSEVADVCAGQEESLFKYFEYVKQLLIICQFCKKICFPVLYFKKWLRSVSFICNSNYFFDVYFLIIYQCLRQI